MPHPLVQDMLRHLAPTHRKADEVAGKGDMLAHVRHAGAIANGHGTSIERSRFLVVHVVEQLIQTLLHGGKVELPTVTTFALVAAQMSHALVRHCSCLSALWLKKPDSLVFPGVPLEGEKETSACSSLPTWSKGSSCLNLHGGGGKRCSCLLCHRVELHERIRIQSVKYVLHNIKDDRQITHNRVCTTQWVKLRTTLIGLIHFHPIVKHGILFSHARTPTNRDPRVRTIIHLDLPPHLAVVVWSDDLVRPSLWKPALQLLGDLALGSLKLPITRLLRGPLVWGHRSIVD